MRFLHPASWPDQIVTKVIAGLLVWLIRDAWKRHHGLASANASIGTVYVKGGTARATASGSGGVLIARATSL